MSGCVVDLVIIVDESTSVGTDNFNVMKTFLSQFVGRLEIDNGNTRVGLFKFSSNVNTDGAFFLNAHSSTAGVQSAIGALTYNGGRTHTAAALEYARTTMLTSANGDRPNVPNVVILLNDGKSNVNREQTPVSTAWNLKKASLFQ